MKYKNANPLSKLHDGEPYFFLRAQDKLAPETVKAYGKILSMEGDNEGRAECYAIAARMEEWQKANSDKVKMPD